MYCPNCGEQLPEGARFCGACGNRLAEPVNMDAAESAFAEELTASGYEEGLSAAERTATPEVAEEYSPTNATAVPEYAGEPMLTEEARVLEAEEVTTGPAQNFPDPDVPQTQTGQSAVGRSHKNNVLPILLVGMVVIVIIAVNVIIAMMPTEEERWQEQYDLGQQYLLELDYEQAIVAFTAAIEIDENNAEAYIGRAEAYLGDDVTDASEENLILALSDYETALSIDDTMAQVYADRGQVYRTLGSMEEALSDYNAALSLDESLWGIYACRGHVYLALGDSESALNDYETAVELDAADEEVYLCAAQICMDQGDYDRAAEFLEKGKTAYPDSEDIRELADDVAAILEEEETRKRYQAYYDKLMELREEYGDASELSDDNWYACKGFSFAKLVDFDGDGREELVTTHSILGNRSWVDDGSSYCNIDYIVQVWDYDGSELTLLFESEKYEFTHLWLAYLSYITFSSSEGKDFLINWYGDVDWSFHDIYGKVDGEFKLLCSLERSGDSTAGEEVCYYIDGVEVDDETYEEFLELYNFEGRQVYYYDGGNSEVSPIEERDRTIEYLEEYLSAVEKMSGSDAVQEGTEEDATDLSLEANLDRYAEILDLFYYGIDTLWTDYGDEGVEEVSYMWYWQYHAAEDLSEAGFAFIDLDGNGIDELLVSVAGEEGLNWTAGVGMIYDLYTWQDGEIIHVLESGERTRYYLCGDNCIYYEGSGGASYSSYEFYILDGSELTLLEIVVYDGWTDPDEPYFYGSGEDAELANESGDSESLTHISEEEADEILAHYEQVSFDLILFDEYTPTDE